MLLYFLKISRPSFPEGLLPSHFHPGKKDIEITVIATGGSLGGVQEEKPVVQSKPVYGNNTYKPMPNPYGYTMPEPIKKYGNNTPSSNGNVSSSRMGVNSTGVPSFLQKLHNGDNNR